MGKNIIKVIIGLRRSGKSFFLKQLRDLLFSEGLEESNLLYIDKENLNFNFIKDYKDLANFIEGHFLNISGKKILFIDEIQEINLWEKTIRSYFNESSYDIYITGSNANLLSTEIATHLAGRTIEFKMYPLSFKEFLEFNKLTDTRSAFIEYLKYGGMPSIYEFRIEEGEKRYEFLRSLYSTIILRDVVIRHQIRNTSMIENLIRYVFSNIGNTFSATSIVQYLKSQRQAVSVDTILTYLSFLEAAFTIFNVKRFDIKGKRPLEILRGRSWPQTRFAWLPG